MNETIFGFPFHSTISFWGEEPSVLLNCFSFCTVWVGLRCYDTTVNSLVETYWCSHFLPVWWNFLFSAYFFVRSFCFFPLPVKSCQNRHVSCPRWQEDESCLCTCLVPSPSFTRTALPSSFPASSPTHTCLHVHHARVEDSFCDCFLWLLSCL